MKQGPALTVRDWRSDDAGLRSWIVKVDRIGSRVGTNIVYAAQEIVRVAYTMLVPTLVPSAGT